MDAGWVVLFTFMLVEALLVLLLVMPMPSNAVRGAIISAVTSVWDKSPGMRYAAFGLALVNILYFWTVFDALIHPWTWAFGAAIAGDPMWSCEQRAAEFERERNAYITGFSLFLFLVLRRLVDIQTKLHDSRADSKAMGSVPVGQPVSGVPVGKKVA